MTLDGRDNPDSLITPAKVRISARQTVEESSQQKTRLNLATTLALVTLLALVVWVVFYLPDKVSIGAPDSADGASTAPPPPITASQSERSPFAEAQLARQRKAAQEVLQATLGKQEAIAEKAVEQWAPDEYQQALDIATAGDLAYQQRDFESARARYQDAGQVFDELLEAAAQRLSEALHNGNTALTNGDADAAIAAFDIALAIDPDNRDGQTGQRRAATIEDVFTLLQNARASESGGDLASALNSFKRAASIDPEAEAASQGIRRINQILADREYQDVMTEGYAALEKGNLEAARQRFQKATELKSSSQQARDALRQVTQDMNARQVSALLSAARSFEANENWSEAEQRYTAALNVDASLLEAQDGQKNARTRAELDRAMTALNSQPERLLNESVYTEAVKLQRHAEGIENPGPRLKEQLATLGKLLNEVRSPSTVLLESDDKTSVTVFKVGNFGTFKKHELSLLPGSYTAVGVRKGFRDVRIEFTIRPGEPAAPVVIVCTEQI